jgi:hypothetical protein
VRTTTSNFSISILMITSPNPMPQVVIDLQDETFRTKYDMKERFSQHKAEQYHDLV